MPLQQGVAMLAPASIAVSLIGCVCTLAIMGYAASWKVGGFVLVVGFVNVIPNLLCIAFARSLRAHPRASAFVLVASLAATAIGVGLPARTFLGHSTDAQGGLIFLVLPFYSGIAA